MTVSSSEDRIDTSDELMDVDIGENNMNCDGHTTIIDSIPDKDDLAKQRRRSYSGEDNEAGTSVANPRKTARDFADDVIRDVEASRARIHSSLGNFTTSQMFHSAIVDENYIVVGAHIDLSTREKIKNSKYVDFAKLLPRDKSPDDHRLELVNKGGQTYFVPVTDRNVQGITGLGKWEQAF